MSTSEVNQKMEPGLLAMLQEAQQRLQAGESSIIVDFEHIHRIDASGIQALHILIQQAEEKHCRLAIRSAGVGVYRVLKLAGLDTRLHFE